MKYRPLGRTGLQVSLAGLGSGGASRLGQGAGRTAAESERVVRAALDLGINLFDSSPSYGGSEELLGQALVGVPRSSYIIATKFQPHRGKELLDDPRELDRQLENSLRLLRVETIDVLQYHGVTPSEYRAVIDRFHETALRAREAGKVRHIGVTETAAGDPTHEMLAQALQDDLFDSIMVKYGILNQAAARRVLPLALKHNAGVFIMASVRTSLRTPQEAVERLSGFVARGELVIPPPRENDPLGLGAVGEPVPTLTRAAYQFAARPAAVSTVLIGTGNVDHLRQNVADMLAEPLSAARVAYLERTYGHLAWNA
jgi:L-galactose dehydrogenase